VNRQIHTEAARILYSETTVVLSPAELLRSYSELCIGKPNDVAFATDPLYGYSKSNARPWLSRGAMQPQVFARFKKVEVVIDPNFLFGSVIGINVIQIDKNFNIDADELKNYTASLQRTHLFKDLVTILAKSPLLKSLKITVFVAVDWVFQDEEHEDVVEEDDEEEDEEEETEMVRLILFQET
jgi:hypothetical protein